MSANINIAEIVQAILLSGGLATRLGELSKILNKHLLPIADWPMIYYPLWAIQEVGIKNVVVITGRDHPGQIESQLGSGTITERMNRDRALFNLSIACVQQDKPLGIAHAIGLAGPFISAPKILVVLGDNIFGGSIKPYLEEFVNQEIGARVLLKEVPEPEHYGVPILEEDRIARIIEKPRPPEWPNPPSNYAVVGGYFYHQSVFGEIPNVQPSGDKGERGVTDLNNIFAEQGQLEYNILPFDWEDAGKSPEELVRINNRMFDERRKATSFYPRIE